MKRSESSRALSLAALALALGSFATCVPLVEGEGLPCPCASDFVCCPVTNTCHPLGSCADDPPAGAGGSSPSLGGTPAGDAGAGAGGAISGAAGDAAAGAGGAGAGVAGDGSTGLAGQGGAGGLGWSECSAYERTSNVLLLIYSPILDNGLDLQAHIRAHDARALAAELVARLRSASAGLINYKIVEARLVNQWPPQRSGTMVLDQQTFYGGVYDPPLVYPDGNADYAAIFADQNVCDVVQEQDISEVWLWGAHNAGVDFGFPVFAYRLAADQLPASATAEDWANYEARRRDLPDCGRTLWVQSGLYSAAYDARAISNRNYNFRIEHVLGWSLRTKALDPEAAAARWAEFSSYTLDAIAPDLAGVGTPSFPPNAGVWDEAGLQAWDWDDPDEVFSGANRWAQYPDLSAPEEPINCAAWSCTDEGFQAWYTAHVPHNHGFSPNGSCNSWWKYFADPDAALPACSGSDCLAEIGMPCASAADCASGHCACQGDQGSQGSWAACSESEGVLCASPNWSNCLQDSDCQSDVCGCDGSAEPKVCLPDAGYCP